MTPETAIKIMRKRIPFTYELYVPKTKDNAYDPELELAVRTAVHALMTGEVEIKRFKTVSDNIAELDDIL